MLSKGKGWKQYQLLQACCYFFTWGSFGVLLFLGAVIGEDDLAGILHTKSSVRVFLFVLSFVAFMYLRITVRAYCVQSLGREGLCPGCPRQEQTNRPVTGQKCSTCKQFRIKIWIRWDRKHRPNKLHCSSHDIFWPSAGKWDEFTLLWWKKQDERS